MANLWSGRFSKSMSELVEAFNASIGFDIRLYEYDIKGSIAHATMLQEQGLLTENECKEIIKGLSGIAEDIRNDKLAFSIADEDIHMAVEGELIRRIGDPGRKLHTARSRNDQTVTDTKLFILDSMRDIFEKLYRMEEVLLDKAEEYKEALMPGFTHLQHAQPVTIGFHLMAYFQMFRRDMERIRDAYRRANYSPLGAGALAGTTLPIDRHRTSELLGFVAPTENAMDTVSDRDYVMELLSDLSIIMIHLSRFSEEFILWNSQEFSFVEIDDSFCTGSSIMPQKKNPDIPELIRGKSGRVIGDLIAIFTMMKGTPLAFNKDFQEDKEAYFDAIDTVSLSLEIFADMIRNSHFRLDEIDKHMSKGFLNATDVAELLVMEGIPFRSAHEIVGKLVKACEIKQCNIEDLSGEEMASIDDRLANITLSGLDMRSCVEKRTSFGGTSPQDVTRQTEVGRAFLDQVSLSASQE